jgi:hypothetical protein
MRRIVLLLAIGLVGCNDPIDTNQVADTTVRVGVDIVYVCDHDPSGQLDRGDEGRVVGINEDKAAVQTADGILTNIPLSCLARK